MGLRDKRAIVTGGGRGIGAATVRCLVADGAHVVVMDVNDEMGREVAATASKQGPGTAGFEHCDISDRQQVEAAFNAACSRLGGLDVLANIAGISTGMELAEEIGDVNINRMIDVNIKGTIYTNQLACTEMKKTNYGKIINFASPAGVNGGRGVATYSATKGAVISWTRAAAREWGRYGIRVNLVNPAIDTPMRHETMAKSLYEPDGSVPKEWAPVDDLFRSGLVVRGRTGLQGDPDEDLGPVMVFLADSASDYITGQMINVDGGMTMVR